MRRTPRAWAWLLVGLVLVAVAGLGPGAVAQEDDEPVVPVPELPIENPLEPTGRAVCNVAFTLASAVGLTSFVVPQGAPLGPNDVIVALRPILATCVAVFPPAPQRRCFTTELYPNTGLPITLPDPVGILTEQLEALAAFVEPLGLALRGPLRDLFVSALTCQDLAEAPGGDGGDPPPVDDGAGTSTSSTVGPSTAGSGGGGTSGPGPTLPSGDLGDGSDDVAAPPAGVGSPADGPTSPISSLPAPLQGGAVAATVAFVVAGALALRRLLSPRREASLLDRTAGPRP